MNCFSRRVKGIVGLILCMGLVGGTANAQPTSTEEGAIENFQKTKIYEESYFSDVQKSDWFYEDVKNGL